MSNVNPLIEIVKSQKKGIKKGIYSACSANEYVIEAVLERALSNGDYALIEATANQVNQFGGYTGMKPKDFKEFVYSIAEKVKFPLEKIILGGDHLGPLTWQNENTIEAMQKSAELIREYVLAGFTKIHIDTSMKLKEDNNSAQFNTKIIAERGSKLCLEAEKAFGELIKKDAGAIHPVYIIGSEVPIPGGSQEEEDLVSVTKVSDFENTVDTFKEAFVMNNLIEAWEYVIAVVVQPGVEFGDESVHDYNREEAKNLIETLKKYPNFVFEGHSTDYQTANSLKAMVQDGIAILKVGPALTFALREGLYSLNYMENELFRYNPEIQLSNFIETLDKQMLKKPDNWQKHYHGTSEKVRFARKYSYSDRCRYYLPLEDVKESVKLLIDNLRTREIPLTLIKQFMPLQYEKIRNNKLKNDPEALLKGIIIDCIEDYIYATNP
ncbi:class II D-tagatose-bisphosphate aldolase non-catalytic subunit [Candidatus Clostridium radicumherbarum]|uniref:Class II D-tagatose-bisphosphate aldolase non-catalytic subunit n=1 Tax=Candidatus Clostridium radicumherbarum TaxID=3381662 RepID=A0ABW8TVS6_9CLOT